MKRILALAITMTLGLGVAHAQFDSPMGPPPGGGQPPMGNDGKPMGPPPGGKPGPGGGGSQYKSAKASRTYSKDAVLTGKTINSSTQDESAVLVTDGTLTMTNCHLTNSADASSTDDASFYGVNAVVCAQPSNQKKGTCTIRSQHNHISGTGRGANGLFAYGNATVNSSYDVIAQTGGNARGIMASGGGTINVVGDTVETRAHSSSCVATDRGGGTIIIDGGVYTCYGGNSAGIYSTGNITARNASFISHGGEGLVIEGTNYINLEECNVVSKFDKWGVLLYQSFSGDAEEGDQATLTVRGGSITYEGTKTGLFYNTNNRDSLSLEGVRLVNASDTLINCKKGGWGNRDTARRGGRLGVSTKSQTMAGLICADSDSQVSIAMTDGSEFTGALNPDNTAASASISLDATSCWSITADSYVNGALRADLASLQSNGHDLYYSSQANPSLGGKTYDLAGGGHLKPM